MRISLAKYPGWQGLVIPSRKPTERWRRSWGNTPNNLQHLTFSCRMMPAWEKNMLSVQFYLGSFNSCLKCSKRTNSSKIPNVQKFLHFPGFRYIYKYIYMYIYKYIYIYLMDGWEITHGLQCSLTMTQSQPCQHISQTLDQSDCFYHPKP